MKKVIAIFLISFFINEVYAQIDSFNIKKYNLLVPNIWKGNAKLILKLTEYVERNFPETQHKQICINCSPLKINVQFYVTQAKVLSVTNISATTNFITRYGFVSYVDLFNDNFSILKRIYLTDSSTTHTMVTNKVNLRKYLIPNELRISPKVFPLTISRQGDSENQLTQSAINTFDVNQYITKNISEFSPSDNELWRVVGNIILNFKL